MKRLVLFSLALQCGLATAVEVTRYDASRNVVWLANVPASEWKIEENVCLHQGKNLLGCGNISAMTKGSVAIRLADRKANIYAGDVVSMKKSYRSPNTTDVVSSAMETSVKKTDIDVLLGLTAGFNYYFPMAQFQYAVSKNFALGLMPAFASYSQNGSSVNFFGMFLTGSYYYTHYAFKGVYFDGGLGFYSLKAEAGNISETKSPIAVKSTVGWRGRALVGAPLDLGVAAGFQYVFASNSPLNTTFEGFLPLLSAYIAYCF